MHDIRCVNSYSLVKHVCVYLYKDCDMSIFIYMIYVMVTSNNNNDFVEYNVRVSYHSKNNNDNHLK